MRVFIYIFLLGLAGLIVYGVGSLMLLPTSLHTRCHVVVHKSKPEVHSFFSESQYFKLWNPLTTKGHLVLNYRFFPHLSRDTTLHGQHLWDSVEIVGGGAHLLKSAKCMESHKDTLRYVFYLSDLLSGKKRNIGQSLLLKLVLKDTLEKQTRVSLGFCYPLRTYLSWVSWEHWVRFFTFYDIWRRIINNENPYFINIR